MGLIKAKLMTSSWFEELTGLVLNTKRAKKLGIQCRDNLPLFEIHDVRHSRRIGADRNIFRPGYRNHNTKNSRTGRRSRPRVFRSEEV